MSNDRICLAIWERMRRDTALGRTRDQVVNSLVLDNYNRVTAGRQTRDYERWVQDPSCVKPPQGWQP